MYNLRLRFYPVLSDNKFVGGTIPCILLAAAVSDT